MCVFVFSLIDEPTDLLGVTQSGTKWIVTISQMLLCHKQLLKLFLLLLLLLLTKCC